MNKYQCHIIFVIESIERYTIESMIRNIESEVSRKSEIKYQDLLEPRLNLFEGRKLTKASTERQVAMTSVNPRNVEVHYGVQQRMPYHLFQLLPKAEAESAKPPHALRSFMNVPSLMPLPREEVVKTVIVTLLVLETFLFRS